MPEYSRPVPGAAAAGPAAALCFSSAGELDVLLPLFRAWGIEEYAVYAFRTELLAKMRDDTFYGGIVDGKLQDRALRSVSAGKLRRWLQFIGNALRVYRELGGYRSCFFEYGNSGREKNILIGMLLVAGRGRRISFTRTGTPSRRPPPTIRSVGPGSPDGRYASAPASCASTALRRTAGSWQPGTRSCGRNGWTSCGGSPASFTATTS